jgi:hypothetical protein
MDTTRNDDLLMNIGFTQKHPHDYYYENLIQMEVLKNI